MRKYTPRVGTIFANREELTHKLERSTWEFEGQSTSLDSKGRVTGYDVGVIDRKRDIWLMIDLVPAIKGVKVTGVRKLKLSDY